MGSEYQFPLATPPSENGQAALQPAIGPDWGWLVRWVLVTTAAIPAGIVLASPFAAIGLWLEKLVAKTGLWQGDTRALLTVIGAAAGFALTFAAAQWYMLRSWVPRARFWFIATLAGLLLGGSVYGIGLQIISALDWDFIWGRNFLLLLAGILLGLMQWLYVRKFIPNAFWIVIIDTLATGSILISGDSITSLPELALILLLPGTITGAGLFMLLRQPDTILLEEQGQSFPEISRRLPPYARLGLGLATLVALFLVCSWAFAASQLALAKNEGIYPSPEEAIIGLHSQGWGGAKVVKIDDVQASPNSHSGALPHVWFGGATIYLDRIPEGYNRTQYSSGSFYIHVREGWVHLPEGVFPEFVGWVMQLYNMEGVREWIRAN